jgi:transcriptional regulator with XRE-family HTH domain
MNLGDNMKNLKKIRIKNKLSQKEMADILTVTQSSYSKYERGLVEPDYDTLIKLAEYFNVSTDYLLGLIEAPFTSEEVAFMRKIQNEKDPDKISKEFDVYIGDQLVTGKELLELMKKMQLLDEKVHGDFFKKKDH